MTETPRSQRARVWAWLYVQLFGTSEDDSDDTSNGAREAAQQTTQETADEEPR